MKHWFVTGGLGFIGSHFVDLILEESNDSVAVVDLVTYAADETNLDKWQADSRLKVIKFDISNRFVKKILNRVPRPDVIVNFAAESHVDRSIEDSDSFIASNVLGTNVMINLARHCGSRFVQVSTDEVYGSVEEAGTEAFLETTPLHPNSPYSASKAAADLLVLACRRTHGIDAVITRSSNNYGPRQHPEKLIPKTIINAIEGAPIPVYGQGLNRRSWIHVTDNCRAIMRVALNGRSGEIYNIGTRETIANITVVEKILLLLNRSTSLIEFIEDRKGHDLCYAVDNSKIRKELGWEPLVSFDDGMKETIEWYQQERDWWRRKI